LPSTSVSFGWKIRAMVSVEPPGGQGTINRIGRSGQADCAQDGGGGKARGQAGQQGTTVHGRSSVSALLRPAEGGAQMDPIAFRLNPVRPPPAPRRS
jgi:hypothetical protein